MAGAAPKRSAPLRVHSFIHSGVQGKSDPDRGNSQCKGVGSMNTGVFIWFADVWQEPSTVPGT